MNHEDRKRRIGAHLILSAGFVFTTAFVYFLWKENWYYAVVFFVLMVLSYPTALLGYYSLKLTTQQNSSTASLLFLVTILVVGSRVNAAFPLPVNRATRRLNRSR